MNLEALIAYTRSLVDEPRDSFVSQTELVRWLNRAQEHVGMVIIEHDEYYFSALRTLTYPANTYQMAVPFSFLRVQLVRNNTTAGSEYFARPVSPTKAYIQYPPTAQTTVPSNYSIKGNAMALHPTPDAAQTLEVTYIPEFEDMIDVKDEPVIPRNFHEILALYAALNYTLKGEGRPEQLMAHYAKLEKGLIGFVLRGRTSVGTRFGNYEEEDGVWPFATSS